MWVLFDAYVSLVAVLYREGLVNLKDTEGIEPGEKDYFTHFKLAEMTAYRRGFGSILADGLVKAASKLGKRAEELAFHIKGHGIVFDPRLKSLGTMEFAEITSPRGAHVATGGSPAYSLGRPLEDFKKHAERMGMPGEAFPRVFAGDSFNVGRLTRYSEDWCSLFDILGLCNRAFVNRFYHVNTISNLYTALTGIDSTPTALMHTAEKAWNLWRYLNSKTGFSRKDDWPPPSWFHPLETGDRAFPLKDYYQTGNYTEKDLAELLDDYYDERGWDKTTGHPSPQKLAELGLD